MRYLVPGVTALMLIALVGCDSGFSVDTGWQPINLNADQLGLQGNKFPAIPCSNDAGCGAGKIPCGSKSFSCKFSCESNRCAVTLTLEQGQKVDLRQVIQNQTTATVLSKVTLDRVVYNTDVNNFTMATPKIALFIGPQNAGSTSANGVDKFAEMPSIPAKTIKHDYVQVTNQGKAKLEQAVLNYQNPFKLFGKASLKFRSGDALPSGRLAMKFKAYFLVDPL